MLLTNFTVFSSDWKEMMAVVEETKRGFDKAKICFFRIAFCQRGVLFA